MKAIMNIAYQMNRYENVDDALLEGYVAQDEASRYADSKLIFN